MVRIRGSDVLFIKLSHSDKWQTAGGGRERKSAEDLARDEWIFFFFYSFPSHVPIVK